VRGALTTADLFPLLGVTPVRGRVFGPESERAGAGRVVLLSEGFWRRRFGAVEVIGRPLLLGGVTHTVIGVLPRTLRLQQEVDVWTPLTTDTALGRRSDFLTVVGRLAPGVTPLQAQEEMSAIAGRLEREYPASNSGWGVELVGLQDQLVGGARPALLVFMGAVALVLLIACANVANLLLARVASRDREVTIRAALGASRLRLVRQLLCESVVLALAGGAVGVLVALWGAHLLSALGPGAIPRREEIGIDPAALGFALALSLVAGGLFGLVAARRALGGEVHEGIREGGRGVSGGVGVRRTRGLLVLSEVALAFMLLVGAALLLRSFARLQQVDPGFARDGLLTARVSLPRGAYAEPAARLAFGERLLERLEATREVRSAALVSDLPLGGSPPYWAFAVAGVDPPAPGVVQDAAIYFSSPGYFSTVGIPLLDGRLFDAADRPDSPPVAVIGTALARRYWPDRSPLGQRITFDDPSDPSATWRTIVGVVGDVRQETLEAPAYPQIYLPLAQNPVRSVVVVARAGGDPLALLPALRRHTGELDSTLPLSEVATMEQVVAATLARPRVNAVLLGGFALVALALAAIGIYGVISYGVIQRTRELGIRTALGADSARLLRLVLRQGMAPVLLGVAIGAAGALAGGRVLTSLLFGVGAADPAAFLAVTVFLLAVALLASWLPARRAACADPMVALRSE
jgi:putative ABC transport system permease protein